MEAETSNLIASLALGGIFFTVACTVYFFFTKLWG